MAAAVRTAEENDIRRQIRKAFLMLLLIPAPLAEILTTNTKLLAFLHPPVFLLMTIVYGIPVLVIREIAVRRGLNILGIMLLGFGYGFINEGVIAKTLTQAGGSPVSLFAGYGQVGVFQGGWAVMIVFWHALHSVLYPILICHWFFPDAARRPWFGRRTGWLMGLLMALIYSAYFLNPHKGRYPEVFVFYILMTALFAATALRFCVAKNDAPPGGGWLLKKPLLCGLLAFFYYGFQYFAPKHLPFPVSFAISFGIVALVLWRTARAGWRPVPEVLLFGLGDDFVFSLVAGAVATVSAGMPIQTGLAEAFFFCFFIWMMRAVKRAPSGRVTGI